MSPANSKYFVDTNILIYAHDRAAGPKHERARQLIEQLWTTGQGALSTQVLQELCVNLRRRIKHPLPSEAIKKLIEDYLSWEIVVNTPQSILAALGIEARYKVSYWEFITNGVCRGPTSAENVFRRTSPNETWGGPLLAALSQGVGVSAITSFAVHPRIHSPDADGPQAVLWSWPRALHHLRLLSPHTLAGHSGTSRSVPNHPRGVTPALPFRRNRLRSHARSRPSPDQ